MNIKITYLFLLCFFPLIHAQNLAEGLLVDYKFDGDLQDSSTNDYDAMNFGATFTLDRFGNPDGAILFDGIDDYVNFPNIEALKPDLPVSFSFWIRHDSTSPDDRDVFNTSFEEDVNTGVYFNSQVSTGNYAVNFGDGSSNYTGSSRRTYVTDKSIDTGKWRYIIITVSENTEMKIYVDCFDNEGAFSGSGGNLQYSSTPGAIGRHDRSLTDPANYFKGAIDDFKYWGRELTADNIEELCNTLSIDDIDISQKENNVIVYPNPADSIIYISVGEEVNLYNDITIYNSLGQQVYFSKFKPEVNVRNFAKGVYYLRLSKENSVFKKTIVIQ